ncbi:MAG: hypothetical protein KF897_12420 [Opitutaceae bacterium]|nr:hypothetical protein [Opitutaceae bacterium]
MSTDLGSPRAPVTLHLSYKAISLFALLLVLPWVVLIFLSQRHGPDSPNPATPANTAPAEGGNHAIAVKAGPWGELSYNRIVIEPPESLIRAVYSAPRQAVWAFKGYTADTFAALMASAGLTPEQRQYLDNPAHREATAGDILLRPPPALIEGLAPEARAIIYTALSEFPENPDQHDPYRFRADAADEWFRHSGLPDSTIALVKKLLYRRGNSLVFSDQGLVLGRIPSLQERVRLIKTLARKSTLMVKLRIRASSDIEALDNYWGRGQRTKDIQPLLQSLVRDGTGSTIDIIHLLPRLPRSLLYTYPAISEPGSTSYLDCHWTVLNFFNMRPDDRYQQLEAVTAAFLNEYYPVTGQPTFGDVIMFAKPDGSVIHSCVYIAADIVYTKNGASPNAPWILMSLSDVEAFYPSKEPLDLQYYRLKSYDRATSVN